MILLVDDNEAVLSKLASMLGSLGFTVFAVNSAKNALAHASKHEQIELLISDIALAEMDGFELYRRLKVRRPRIKSLFLSGFLTPDSLPGDRNMRILRKPVQLHELRETIAELIEDPAANSTASDPG